MIERRNKRQDAIREIVRTKPISTQSELVDELTQLGFSCTQATVSRDIADMGLRKVSGGSYVPEEDLRFHQLVSTMVEGVDHADNLVVVKTHPGSAQGVAAAIDDTQTEGVLGTIAGDDTILLITRNEAAAIEFEEMVGRIVG